MGAEHSSESALVDIKKLVVVFVRKLEDHKKHR